MVGEPLSHWALSPLIMEPEQGDRQGLPKVARRGVLCTGAGDGLLPPPSGLSHSAPLTLPGFGDPLLQAAPGWVTVSCRECSVLQEGQEGSPRRGGAPPNPFFRGLSSVRITLD